jgi:hypothetical protein
MTIEKEKGITTLALHASNKYANNLCMNFLNHIFSLILKAITYSHPKDGK